jgi:maleylpyruvate isomerase
VTGPGDARAALAADLGAVAEATTVLLGTLAAARPDQMDEPSLLPGWNRGHVAGHIVGNADGMLRLLDWALTGRPNPMYDSLEARQAGIDEAAALDLDSLRTRVATSSAHLADGFDRLLAADAEALQRLVYFGAQEPVGGPDTPAFATSYARLREVEIHHVDLDLGYGPRDWPPAFVERTLTWLDGRSPAPAVVGDPAEVLAWRLGRGTGPSVRAADGGPAPVPPPW